MLDPHLSFTERFRVPLRILGVIALFGLMYAVVHVLTLTGPGKTNDNPDISDRTRQTQELETRSNALREEFLRNTTLRVAAEEDYALLDEALAAEQRILDINSQHNRGASERIERLKTLRDEHRAKALTELSLLAEQEYEKSEDREVRIAKIEEAWQLQNRINSDYSKSSGVNFLRGTRLRRDLEHLRAEPLYQQSLDLYEQSVKAQAEGKWLEGVEKLEGALNLQVELNDNYQGLRFASARRLSKLREELDSLRAADMRQQMQEMEELITKASAAGNYQQVTAAVETMLRLQEAINREYGNSRFASRDAIENLNRRREEARSRGLANEILEQSANIDSLLRARNSWEAAEEIRKLSTQLDSFAMSFAESRLLGDELTLKYKFLNSLGDRLGKLQDTVYEQLLPLPGQKRWMMLRTEVPQSLYEQVMSNANPSRQRGAKMPVDSVNHGEAVEFARRISWILGLPARLPDEAQFRQALGRDRYVRLADQTWNLDNAEARTQDVGTREANGSGFYDLLGNVSEWLHSDNLRASLEAYQIGGSVENSVDQLADVPMVIANAQGRNRYNGFRIVVDTVPPAESSDSADEGSIAEGSVEGSATQSESESASGGASAAAAN